MSRACSHKLEHDAPFCVGDCPVGLHCGTFDYLRVERHAQVPEARPEIVDVAVLDMNHGWPNLGHDCLVHLVQDAVCDIQALLVESGLCVRVLSFDVRRGAPLPEPPHGRFALYLGTGGPGHLDPRHNDGEREGSQGIREDASWEPGCFELFDRILADRRAALLAVCHTFGVMCRWSGIAQPLLRGPEKHGKSTGLLENLLTAEARRHPWFARLGDDLPDGRRLRIADNRLYDLIPGAPLPEPLLPIGFETLGLGGPVGDALTMVEWARDEGGRMPRVFAVNHHPEIVDRERQHMLLERKFARGEVDRPWYEERLEVLTRTLPDEDTEARLALTSEYTIVSPLRFHLYRQVRERAQALGRPLPLDEVRAIEARLGAFAPARA